MVVLFGAHALRLYDVHRDGTHGHASNTLARLLDACGSHPLITACEVPLVVVAVRLGWLRSPSRLRSELSLQAAQVRRHASRTASQTQFRWTPHAVLLCLLTRGAQLIVRSGPGRLVLCISSTHTHDAGTTRVQLLPSASMLTRISPSPCTL